MHWAPWQATPFPNPTFKQSLNPTLTQGTDEYSAAPPDPLSAEADLTGSADNIILMLSWDIY